MKKKGFITKEDVKHMSGRMGFPLNDKECELLIAIADRNSDGNLNSKEFLSLITCNDIIHTIESKEFPKKIGE